MIFLHFIKISNKKLIAKNNYTSLTKQKNKGYDIAMFLGDISNSRTIPILLR